LPHAGRSASCHLGSRPRPGRDEQNPLLRCAERPQRSPSRDCRSNEATLWQGFFAPSSIDPALAARIAADVEAVLKQPETRANLGKAGVALFEDNQANFKKFFHADIEKWKNLVKSTHLKLE